MGFALGSTPWTRAVVSELGARGVFQYRYDMGDGWEHRIVIESAPASRVDLPAPMCLAGENACPPEDVGGAHGYADFLEALGDRQHEQHDDTMRWIGGVFDPKGFDLNRINREWRYAKRRSRLPPPSADPDSAVSADRMRVRPLSVDRLAW